MEELFAQCIKELSGPTPGGRDLSCASVAADSAALKRHQIVQAFQDPRNADWNALFEDALAIVQEESKDLYALWGVLAPLPVVRSGGFEGVAVGVAICNKFLGELWEAAYPAVPDGLNARASVFSELARRWTRFAQQHTAGPKDADSVAGLVESLQQFAQSCKERFPDDRAPQVGELRQLVSTMHASLAPPEPEEGEPGGDATAAPGEPDAGSVRPQTASEQDDLERAYQEALRLIDRQPQVALDRLNAIVKRQASRACRFRGQVYLGELYLRAGQQQLAKQMLSFLDEESEKIKLEDWEPELCAKLWATLYQAMDAELRALGGDAPSGMKDKLEELFARVCRVDPIQAITLKSG